jgi:Domain of unknown function (DUF4190)
MTERKRVVFNEEDFADDTPGSKSRSPNVHESGGRLPPVGPSAPLNVGIGAGEAQSASHGYAQAPPTPPSAIVTPEYVRVVPQKTNGFAVAALVLGILWIYWIGSLLALIFGLIAKGQIDRSGGTESGRGMAIAGIVLGLVGLGMFVLLLIIGASIGVV